MAILGDDLGGPNPYEEILHRDLLFVHLWCDNEKAGRYRPLQFSMVN